MAARYELAGVVAEMRKLGIQRADFADDGAIRALILGPPPPPDPPPDAEKDREDPLAKWEREQRRIREVALRATGGVRSPVE